MKKQTLTFIRMGSCEVENLVAVEVSLDNPKHDAHTQLTKAITQWVEETQEGADIWDESCGDLNIGDLLNASTDELNTFLIRNGISGMETKYEFFRDDVIPYDTVLAEPVF